MEDHKIFGVHLNPLDAAALAVFFAGWIGYTWFAADRGSKRACLTSTMGEWREDWARQMLVRDNRMVDMQLIAGLLRIATFFASTTILIVAGLSAALGAADQMMSLVTDLPFVQTASRAVWEIKILMLIVIFIYAFFKFTWCIRLHSYCATLVGAAPPPPEEGSPGAGSLAYAHDVARVSTLASLHFNNGLRAYYFGLAAVTWFLHPYAVFAATVWVILVLYRREFRSRALGILRSASMAGRIEGGA